jgi:hypothetical protein
MANSSSSNSSNFPTTWVEWVIISPLCVISKISYLVHEAPGNLAESFFIGFQQLPHEKFTRVKDKVEKKWRKNWVYIKYNPLETENVSQTIKFIPPRPCSEQRCRLKVAPSSTSSRGIHYQVYELHDNIHKIMSYITIMPSSSRMNLIFPHFLCLFVFVSTLLLKANFS